ncbi:MAG: cellulase family glycosylhydrolase [Pirellulales bacterium]|nr:cellulase family glycosylhydrolase [Pirellulales bacterium]
MNTLSFTRRNALKSLAAGALTAGLARLGDARGPAPSPARPSLHVYPDYGWLRGFSMVPSWGARIEEAWWAYDGAGMREEAALARQVHANCIRLWIEFTAWMADPEKVTANFLDAVKAIGECGMKAMPCLFNRWHDSQWDYGGTYTETLFRDWKPQVAYVRELVTPLSGDDRVLIWDLCNEPQAHDLGSEVNQREFAWLKLVAETVRDCGARQPITIGTMNGKNIETFAPLVDVLCAHPYAHTRGELESLIGGYHAIRTAHRKSLLVNECIPGSLSDATRAQVARFYTELLSAAGLGWMGWALREGKAISTRRDRYDANGINREGFHPFFTKAGRLRDGLEFLTERPKLRAPWEKD